MKAEKIKIETLILLTIKCLLLIIAFSTNCYAQLHKIHLKKVITDKIETGYDYQLINPSDSIYIIIKYQGDFGLVNYSTFLMKDNLPDGDYKIYIDDKLREELCYKSGFKTGVSIKYRENGEKEIMTFSKGKVKGNVFEYFKNGSIKSKSYFNSNGIKRRILFYESGNVKMKEYFRENKQFKIKRYDAQGNLLESKKL